MNVKMSREEVYKLIDGERAYQSERWNDSTTTSGGNHSFEEWIVYIEHYTAQAKAALTMKPKQEADVIASDIMRKVAALAVAAMENNGSVPRKK